jgi:hypothetical protein
MKRLPVMGNLEAIDRQSLRIENIGPYVASSRAWLRRSKAEMIQSLLEPTITVNARPEEWELFKIRMRFGLRLPPIIVNGLDNVGTRHSVQRLWPDCVVDMAAGGLNSQVIVKIRGDEGICLLTALQRPESEVGWAERLSADTGLSAERIREEATTAITEEDIANAPPEQRGLLARARERGQLLCGRITQQNLELEGADPDFAPVVPFVTAFSGVVGAAETMKRLMGQRAQGMHFQASFASGRSRSLVMHCGQSCECRALARIS